MNVIAMIPARLEATRFPRKLLQVLEGKSILQRTWEKVQHSGLFSQVLVICDDQELVQEVKRFGGMARLSSRSYESGTDRIAEFAGEANENDILINVQGDEPFIEKEALQLVIGLFQDPRVEIASLMIPITDEARFRDPNCVKVVCNAEGKALYFSRAPIPYHRSESHGLCAFQHVGVYGFRKEALLRFTALPVSKLEQTEKLENLRMLEHGFGVYLCPIQHTGISIDTPEDFERARAWIQEHPE
ncbi:MAG TPA: 3-deoxy-manno-octulosonate cytidylyltransferase [Chitinophagaceae bacterium]|nr:3-deoxy-manno-octulosonate cytidylyltransferase [Chitinophagaceae bacterium]HNF71526.1 3-deoxy-manno-octulosonate cytidylyltransferase [Chitinophagaceae bacterium]